MQDVDRSTLTEVEVFEKPGEYQFQCTGPMIVVGNCHNKLSPGQWAYDFINEANPHDKVIRVFFEPGAYVTFKRTPKLE
jgi:hypothetical protein